MGQNVNGKPLGFQVIPEEALPETPMEFEDLKTGVKSVACKLPCGTIIKPRNSRVLVRVTVSGKSEGGVILPNMQSAYNLTYGIVVGYGEGRPKVDNGKLVREPILLRAGQEVCYGSTAGIKIDRFRNGNAAYEFIDVVDIHGEIN